MARVLIVDDSGFQRRRINEMVQSAGHETEQASNGNEGLEQNASWHPDLILLDLIMPECTGFQFLERLRGGGDLTPVIVLSSDIQNSVKERCASLGAQDFVCKPPKKDSLLETIEEVLGVAATGAAK